MRLFARSISVLLFIIILCSCNNRNNFSKNETDSLLYKIIHFPNDLFELRENEFLEITHFLNRISGKKKVVSIVDASCMKCIVNELNKLDSVFSPICIGNNVELIFILVVIVDLK